MNGINISVFVIATTTDMKTAAKKSNELIETLKIKENEWFYNSFHNIYLTPITFKSNSRAVCKRELVLPKEAPNLSPNLIRALESSVRTRMTS